MNLAKLMRLAVRFNIDPNDLGFHGEHDEIYLDVAEKDIGNLPTPKEFSEWDNEAKEAFTDKYGIHLLEGDGWGFYS